MVDSSRECAACLVLIWRVRWADSRSHFEPTDAFRIGGLQIVKDNGAARCELLLKVVCPGGITRIQLIINFNKIR